MQDCRRNVQVGRRRQTALTSRFVPPWQGVRETLLPYRAERSTGRVRVLARSRVAIRDTWTADGSLRQTLVFPFAVVTADAEVLVIRAATAPLVVLPEAQWKGDDHGFSTAIEDGAEVEIHFVACAPYEAPKTGKSWWVPGPLPGGGAAQYMAPIAITPLSPANAPYR